MTAPTYESPCGTVKLWLGDSYSIVPTWNRLQVSLLLIDPPYELTATGGGIGRSRQYLSDIDGFTDGGFDEAILDYADNWICFCAKTQLPSLIARAAKMPRWMLATWNKPNPTPLCNGNYLPDTEYIVHGFQSGRCFGEYRDKSRYIVYPAQQNNHHPNEKPIQVVSKFVSVDSEPGDVIADTFMGSGSTGVSSLRLGRRFWGIESDPKHFATAKKRIIAELPKNKTPLFSGVEMRETQQRLGLQE